MRYGYRAGQSAFRFARARNANLCSWASDFNAAYGARRGLASMGSFASAFAAVPQVMGEAPSLASKGFSEQVQKMSGIANAAENSPSDADEEEGEIDLSMIARHSLVLNCFSSYCFPVVSGFGIELLTKCESCATMPAM